MQEAELPGNLTVVTCISSAAVSSLTLLISTNLSLALFARAFPNRLRQYVSHESALRPLERRFRLLFFASVLMVLDSLNHMFYFGSLWLLHDADALLYRVIYVATSSTASPLIVFAIVHRCIFIVGQNCPRRRWRLLAIAFALCLCVSLAVGISGIQIIWSLLEVGKRSDHADLWTLSPYVSKNVSTIIVILPTLVLGSSVWALAHLVRTSKSSQAKEAQAPPAPRISVMSVVGSATSSCRDPSQNTLADSGNQLDSTPCNINAKTSVCTTVLPSLDAVDSSGKESPTRSVDILSSKPPLSSQFSKMAKRATSSAINLKVPSRTAIDSFAPAAIHASAPLFSPQQSAPTYAVPSQQLAYPLSRSFLILTLLLMLLWIGVLGIASQGAFVGPIRSATLMSLLGVLGCWVDASFESLARVAAKRQNEHSLDTLSANLSFFSTIHYTVSRAMGGGSRRQSEQAGMRRMSNQAPMGSIQLARSPTVLRPAPTGQRIDVIEPSNARHHGPGDGLQGTHAKGSYAHTGSYLQRQQVGKGLTHPPGTVDESLREGSVEMVNEPQKRKMRHGMVSSDL